MLQESIVCGVLNQQGSLQWRHNEHDGISNHQPHHCLLNRLFGRRSKKTSKLRITGLCVGNSPGTGEFPAQMVSNVENVSIWWRHHDTDSLVLTGWAPGYQQSPCKPIDIYNHYHSSKPRSIFTQDQYWPDIFIMCVSVCRSVRPCVNKFVCMITHHPFKLVSPNLDQRCKRPWLRLFLFCRVIDHDLQCQIQLLKVQIYSILSLSAP